MQQCLSDKDRRLLCRKWFILFKASFSRCGVWLWSTRQKTWVQKFAGLVLVLHQELFFTLPFKQRLHGPSIAEELLENWFMLEETGNLVVLAF